MSRTEQSVAASTFKARCLALLDRVAASGEPIVVTKRGKPVARVVPVRETKGPTLRRSVTTHGDIVGPILDDWNVDR